jgi:hypothetical protein
LMFFAFFPSRFRTRGLNVNTILDLLDEDEVLDAEGIYLDPPEGDESDGYDVSDTEEGEPTAISRNLLQVCLLPKLAMYSTIDVKSNPLSADDFFVQFFRKNRICYLCITQKKIVILRFRIFSS